MNRAGVTIQFGTCILFSILIAISFPNPATASIIVDGDISPLYPGSIDVWNAAGDLFIGNTSDGSINITGGSGIYNTDGYIGYDPNTFGIVTVTGINSFWQNSVQFYVGYQGEGEIVISNGGSVKNSSGFIAHDPNSTGKVTVTGKDSLWQNSIEIHVGHSGEGELVISDGGRVTNIVGHISYNPGSKGKVTVTGQDSLWQNSSSLYVGSRSEAEMLISDGGKVTNTWGYIAWDPNSRGRVTVTGQGSLWENSSLLYIGHEGVGEMLIFDGGIVTNTSGYIAKDPNSRGSVTVTGQGSLWQNSGDVYVGGTTSPGGTGLLNISNGGTLEASSVMIWPTGTLSGDGRIVSGSVLNSGMIKPGSPIGTLTIDGDLTIESGSIYEAEIDNSGNNDRISVTGDVEIDGGTLKVISTETITGSQQYTLIEATSVTGTFETFDTALLGTGLFPEKSLDYEPNSVLLQVEATRFDDPGIVQTENQLSLGRALQQIAAGGGSPVTTALQNLETDDQVRVAYDQLCGQTRPQLTPVTAADTSKFMSIVSDRLNYASAGMSYYGYGFGSGPLLAMAEPDNIFKNMSMYDNSRYLGLGADSIGLGYAEWGFWGRGYGVLGDRKSKAGVPGYDYTIYGTSFGMDYQISDNSLMGITAGYSVGDVESSLAGNNSNITGMHIGIYGNKNIVDWHFDSILTYNLLEYETERIVDMTSEQLKGDTNGQGISGYLEARYDFINLFSWFLQPLASFQISYLDLDGYTESGGTSSLGFDDQGYNSYKGSLGFKASKELFREDYDRSVHIQLRGRWMHEFGDDNSSVDAHFTSDPGVVFKVSDEKISRDSTVFGAGLNAYLSRYTRLSLGYDAHLNDDDNMHVLSATLVYRW